MSEKKAKLNYKKNRFRKSFIRNQFLRIFVILLLIAGIFVGFYFSLDVYYENKTLDGDFGGYYTALVAIDSVSEDNRNDGQPNGDASVAASALQARLDPLGTNNISIETSGSNFLKVSAPKSRYNSESLFKSSIERSGSIYFIATDTSSKDVDKYDDIFVKKNATTILQNRNIQDDATLDFTRDPLSNYISASKGTTINSNTGRIPAIEYQLNGTNFSDYLKNLGSNDSNQTTVSYNLDNNIQSVTADDGGDGDSDVSKPAAILIDADSLYNLVREYFLAVSNRYSTYDKVNQYYTQFIEPLRKTYKASTDNEIVKKVLYDMFFCSYTLSSDPNKVLYGSLIDDTNLDFDTAKSFYSNGLYSSINFLSSTSNYVYDSNAKTEDFENDGQYAKTYLYNEQTKKIDTNISVGNAHQIFNAINPIICDLVLNLDGTGSTLIDESVLNDMLDYFVFNGTISNTQKQNVAIGQSFILGGQYFVTFVKSYSLATLGSSLFNASSTGFKYTVSSISEFLPKISSNVMMIFIIVLVVIGIALLTYLVLVYRILGLISALFILIVGMLTLVSSIWFTIPTGFGVMLSLLIIIGLNTNMYIHMIECIKTNVFNKKRNVNSSFSIFLKENLTSIIDCFVCVLISNVCILWIASSELKQISILLSIGVLYSLGIFLIVALIAFKLICKTITYEKGTNLFAWNFSIFSTSDLNDYFKIKKINDKIFYLQNYVDLKNKKIQEKYNDKIFYYDEKIAFLVEAGKFDNSDKIKRFEDEKANVIKLCQNEIDLNLKKIFNFDEKIKKLEIQMSAIKKHLGLVEIKLANSNVKEDIKNIVKFKKRIFLLNERISYYHNILDAKKIKKNEYKLSKAETLLKIWENRLLADQKYFDEIQLNVNNIVNASVQKYIEIDKTEDADKLSKESLNPQRSRNKLLNGHLKIWNKFLSIFFGLILITSIFVGIFIGPNYDYSFSNVVDYTFWGEVVDNAYDQMIVIDQEWSAYEFSDNIDGLKNILDKSINNYDDAYQQFSQNEISDIELYNVEASVTGFFLTSLIENNLYLNSFLELLPSISGHGTMTSVASANYSYGTGFILENTSNNQQDDTNVGQWVTISVSTTNDDQTFYIKEVLSNTFNIGFQDASVSQYGGAISKRTRPSSGIILIKQLFFGLIISMLILLFYFIVRFKWTYFVSTLFSMILIIGIMVATIIGFHIPFGINTLIIIIFITSFLLIELVMMCAKAKKALSSKDEKKLTSLFKKEIETVFKTKQAKKSMSDQLYNERIKIKNFKDELYFKNKTSKEKDEFKKSLTKIVKKDLKNQVLKYKFEYRQLKAKLKLEYLLEKNKNKIEIIKERENNTQLNKIESEIYIGTLKRILIVSAFYFILALVFIIFAKAVITIGISMLVGIIIASSIILYICIPLLVFLETRRIHIKIANKNFVNSLFVSNEEQIVKNIND